MLGKNEVPNRSEIMSYLHDGGQDLDPHKLAWCAAFVSASLQKAGLPVPTQVVKDSAFGPGAYAPNYLSYGSAVDPKNIQAGDILVNNNGSHVGFATGAYNPGTGRTAPKCELLAKALNQGHPAGSTRPALTPTRTPGPSPTARKSGWSASSGCRCRSTAPDAMCRPMTAHSRRRRARRAVRPRHPARRSIRTPSSTRCPRTSPASRACAAEELQGAQPANPRHRQISGDAEQRPRLDAGGARPLDDAG